VTESYDESSYHEGSSRSDEAVGEISADQRRQPDKTRVRSIQAGCLAIGPLQRVDEIENEKGSHPVVGEALPHLDNEQKSETTWMPE
jgi:hypothetical protein